MPSSFLKVWWLSLAAQVCMPVANSRTLQENILGELQDAIDRAERIGAIAQNKDKQPADGEFQWVSAR